MKRIMKKALLMLGVALLASCADTSELYPGNAYVGQNFIANRYSTRPDEFKGVETKSTVTLENVQNGYFNGSGEYDAPNKCQGLKQAKQWHPDYFKQRDKELTWVDPDLGADIINGGVGAYRDQSSLYNTVYSQAKKLSRISERFSKGYLSKLYNGQVRCNAWSYYSMVLLDQAGYGTLFPMELSEATYFAFSARGGRNSNDSRKGNVVSFDIAVDFYRYKEDGKTLVKNEVILNDVKLQANYSAEYTSLVGFTFADAGIKPSGIVGMDMHLVDMVDTYEDEDGHSSSMNFEDDAYYHTGLCLLEVLIPDSTWY